MKIVEMELGSLIPYENNPRINDEAVAGVKASIKEFGFKVPIIIDKNNVIVAGHTRYKASIELGLDKVPCIIADDLTDDQIKAFRIADNKVAEKAEWDLDLLQGELETIEMDMSGFGFDLFEDEEDIEVEEIKAPEPPKEAKSKIGEMYRLGNHVLMCGDATNPADTEKLRGGVTPRFILY